MTCQLLLWNGHLASDTSVSSPLDPTKQCVQLGYQLPLLGVHLLKEKKKSSKGLLIDTQLIPTDLAQLKTDARKVCNHKEKEISS